MFYLLIGFLIGILGVPVLDRLVDLISTIIELLKAKISEKIVECNVKINELKDGTQNTHTRVIGFTTTPNKEKEEDYE